MQTSSVGDVEEVQHAGQALGCAGSGGKVISWAHCLEGVKDFSDMVVTACVVLYW